MIVRNNPQMIRNSVALGWRCIQTRENVKRSNVYAKGGQKS
jgi:hypothetical protein